MEKWSKVNFSLPVIMPAFEELLLEWLVLKGYCTIQTKKLAILPNVSHVLYENVFKVLAEYIFLLSYFQLQLPISRQTYTVANCPLTGVEKLPHNENCSKFYLCINGISSEYTCAEGSLYNPKNKRCDRPEKTKCFTGWNNDWQKCGHEIH